MSLAKPSSLFCFVLLFFLRNLVSAKISTNNVVADIYTLFDGLTYNTRGCFASCVVFFRATKRRGKIRAMSKISARINMLNQRIRDLLST